VNFLKVRREYIMLSIALSIAACFGWGIADFIGGFKSRELPTLSVMLIANITGIFCLVLIIGSSKSYLPYDVSLIWSAPAGFFGLVAMYLLYRSLAVGMISILAPVSATGVILPVVWGIICGDTLPGLQLSGMIMAFIGTLLAVMESGGEAGKVKTTRGIHQVEKRFSSLQLPEPRLPRKWHRPERKTKLDDSVS
jgi:drug/metabolite transporter (DMT)-like permease